MNKKTQSLWDKFWKDNKGKVVVWQTPNLFIIGWVVLTIISLLLNGTVSDIFGWAASISAVIWSLLEIIKGVNYFRRSLGIIVLVLITLSIIHSF